MTLAEMKAEDYVVQCIMGAPIAAVLPAEPGWRVVVGEPQENGEWHLVVKPIYFWAVEPVMILPRQGPSAPLSSLVGLMQVMAGAGKRREPVYPLYPLDEQKRRYDARHLHTWVGPDETDVEVLQRVVAYIEKEAAAALAKQHAAKAPTP